MKKIPRIRIRHKITHYLMVATIVGGMGVVGSIATGGHFLQSTSVSAASRKKQSWSSQTTTSSTTTTTSSPTSSSIASSTTTSSSTTSPTTSTSSSTTTTAPSVALTSSPRGMGLYVDPSLANAGRPAQIASQPTGAWLGGWSGDVQAAANSIVSAATSQGKLATLVAYNIPGRDCGSYSAGGSATSDAYKTWIRQMAAGVGNRQAIVILEPDALAQISCLPSADQQDRYALLSDAVNVFATQTKAFVYLDAGHTNWIDTGTMASRLSQANIAQARGFSLNVSNFYTTADNTTYGNQISASTGGKPFVIDTGRNGNGSNGEWCNPSGRALGVNPTTNVGGNVDAYLWVKVPGESDGTCNGGPTAGMWWQDYALSLIANR